jgi:hypothetical protein
MRDEAVPRARSDDHGDVGLGHVRAAARARGVDAQIDAGVELGEAGEPRQQHLAREVGGHVQPHAVAPIARAQLLGDRIQAHEQVVYLLEVTRAGVRERERASAAREQR